MKAIPKYADASADDLRLQVRTWHDRALPFIGTKSFDETWSDFVYAWPRVRYPKGKGPLVDCLSRARAAPLPTAPSRYEDTSLRLLVALCAELQRSSGNNPFFLSCRSLGDLLRIDRMTALRRLHLLVHDGILVVAQPGTTKRATRYHYIDRRTK
ncbi:MAG: hypothetical protein AABZ47_14060 [Planctomycetota bacterium]